MAACNARSGLPPGSAARASTATIEIAANSRVAASRRRKAGVMNGGQSKYGASGKRCARTMILVWMESRFDARDSHQPPSRAAAGPYRRKGLRGNPLRDSPAASQLVQRWTTYSWFTKFVEVIVSGEATKCVIGKASIRP